MGFFSRVCVIRRLGSVCALACLGMVWMPGRAQAARYAESVDESAAEHRGVGHFDLGFDGEGAIPLGISRSPVGNDLSGGGGFKVRVGDQIRFPRLRVTPEIGYGYDHLFASDIAGNSYAWDMHRLIAGVRLGFGRVIVPTLYGHLGYGWRDTGDPAVSSANGLAVDGGFALDLHVIPHLGFGGHVEYAMIDAQQYTPHWLALGLHGDIAF